MTDTLKNNQKTTEKVNGWTILARDAQTEQQWMQEIRIHQRSIGQALGEDVSTVHQQLYSMILIDQKRTGWREWAKNLDRAGKSIVLVVEEESFMPAGEDLQLVDDVIVYPFRLMELVTHYRQHQVRKVEHGTVDEMKQVQAVFSDANETIERLLQARTPKRFSGLKGLSIMSRHISGLKPGGDYFDVFESDRNTQVNFLLADSSSYGLSSALLGAILSSSAKIATGANMKPSTWISAIYEELKVTLGEKEHLSLFFGRLNRLDFTLHYQLYGSVEGFIVDTEGNAKALDKLGGKINSEFLPITDERVLVLNPKDRVVLLSDGFVNGLGGEEIVKSVFLEKKNVDPFFLVNELSFRIKSKLLPGETFPGEDCSAIVIDVEKRVLRLAS